MDLSDGTLDIIDAIADRGLAPISYSGRNMYGRECVACVVPRDSSMEGLKKNGARVDQFGRDYVVYWPAAEWNTVVQKYVDIITDSSGEAA